MANASLNTNFKRNTPEDLVANVQYNKTSKHFNASLAPARVRRPRKGADYNVRGC